MDDPGGSNYRLWLTVILLSLSALFSGSETAFFSSSQVRLRQLQEKGVKKADLVQRLIDDGQRLLSTLLVGNTIVNIFLTSLVTTACLDWLGSTFGAQIAGALATVITTILLLIFGEVTPKAIAASAPESFALLLSQPALLFHCLLRPIVSVFNFITAWGGAKNSTPTPSVTEDTILTALSISEEEGALRQESREMIHGIFASDDTTIGRIMVPRERITAIPVTYSIQEALRVLLDHGYSRVPVYEQDIDDVIGLIYAKDLLPQLRSGDMRPIKDLLRPVLPCRPTHKLNQLLQEMQTKRMHLAIVTNSQGKTVGLVTMEDLLEEIVGEIADEHDSELAPNSLYQEGVASC